MDSRDSESSKQSKGTQTNWHQFLAKGFELSVGARGVLVQTEVEVMSQPPKVDIVLLRRESARWTPEQLELLPDGIRDTDAKHVLIEFKYTESLTLDAILQALGYEYFYRTANHLSTDDVKMFILCAKTPRDDRLEHFGYVESTVPGLFHSEQVISKHVPLIVLNKLSNEPYNVFVKAFASNGTQKRKAFDLLRQMQLLPKPLLTYFDGLRTIWSLPEGVNMDEILTPERVMEYGERWLETLQTLPPETLDAIVPAEYKQSVLQQGRERGIEQGREQGIEQGREQGIVKERQEIVRAMHKRGVDLALIADITGLTTEQVTELLVGTSAYDDTASGDRASDD